MRVYKYQLVGPNVGIRLEMPLGAKILCVQTQHDIPCVWAEVDPDAFEEMRRFKIVASGVELPDEPREYIGTFQYSDGSVFHVYERK